QKTGLDPALMERLKSLGYAGFSGGGNPTISNRELPDPKDRIQVYELISDAIAESQHGEYAQSIEKLNSALKTEPDSVAVHYLLGLNFYRMRDYQNSVEQFRKVVKLSPDYALAAFHLGLAYARTGQVDEAVAELRKAAELVPDDAGTHVALARALTAKGLTGEAEQEMRKARQAQPQ